MNFTTLSEDIKPFMKERKYALMGPERRFFETQRYDQFSHEDGFDTHSYACAEIALKTYNEVHGEKNDCGQFVYRTYGFIMPVFTANLQLIARAADRFIDKVINDTPVVKHYGPGGENFIIWRATPVVCIEHWDFYREQLEDADGNPMPPETAVDQFIDEAYEHFGSEKDEGAPYGVFSRVDFSPPKIKVRFRMYGYHKD